MSRPPILIVGPTPPPFIGPAVNTRAMLDHRRMTERFEVHHLDTSDRRTIENMGRFDWTNVWLAGRHGAELAYALARWRPALVYLPISPSTLGLLRDLLFMIPAAATTKLVIHQRGGRFVDLYDSLPAPMRVAVAGVLARASRVIVLGDALRYNFEPFVDERRILVIPNGVPPNDAPPIAHDHVQVTYLGNLIPEKGFPLVLEVARRLAGQSDIRFRFAGAFPTAADEAAFARQVREHRLEGTVEHLGVVTGADKASLLQLTDIFVFPSSYAYEGHPTVILEAMAAGLAVVATDHAAIPETVIDGETGRIVPKGDAEALTAAIRDLADDAALRERLGAAGRARQRARYTVDACIGALVEAFEGALAEG